MYVRCDESVIAFPKGLTMSTQPLTGNFSAECPGIIKTMHTGFSAYTCYVLNFGMTHGKTGRANSMEEFV